MISPTWWEDYYGSQGFEVANWVPEHRKNELVKISDPIDDGLRSPSPLPEAACGSGEQPDGELDLAPRDPAPMHTASQGLGDGETNMDPSDAQPEGKWTITTETSEPGGWRPDYTDCVVTPFAWARAEDIEQAAQMVDEFNRLIGGLHDEEEGSVNYAKARQDFEWALRDRAIKLNAHVTCEVWEIVCRMLHQCSADAYEDGYAAGQKPRGT